MRLSGPSETINRAKALRRDMSLPEVLLWQALRGRKLGLRFRRQHPTGPHVLDFYCDAARLCVEVDGEAHDRGDRPVHDARRDAWLARQGVRTYRILASDVLTDLEAVCHGIVKAARTPSGELRSPPPHRGRTEAGNPPPQGEVSAKPTEGVS